jgi:hypothetical protein
MTPKEKLLEILDTLPDIRVWEVIDFARYLRWQEHLVKEEREAWLGLRPEPPGMYGPDEPEYTEADLKPELNRPEPHS